MKTWTMAAIDQLVEDCLDELCMKIQGEVSDPSGDIAAMYWDDETKNKFYALVAPFIVSEISSMYETEILQHREVINQLRKQVYQRTQDYD